MIIVFVNKNDLASVNIKSNLDKLGYSNLLFFKIIEIEENFLDLTNDDYKSILSNEQIEYSDDLIFVFASKHCSEKNMRSLTVHSNALFDAAKISKTDSVFQTMLFRQLNLNYAENKDEFSEPFEVTFEVSHHTPILKIPGIFIEIGSTQKEWNDEFAGRIIAKSIIETVTNFQNEEFSDISQGISIGGPHYAPNLSRYMLKEEYKKYFVGHMVPKYALEFLTSQVLSDLLVKSKSFFINDSKVFIFLDWKGLGQYKEQISAIVDELSLEDKDFEIIKVK